LQEWARQGRKLPPGYTGEPEILPIAGFYWRAFLALSSERQIGMGLGPIPFRAYVRFADVYGISSIDDFDVLRGIVEIVDGEYLKINQPKKDGAPAEDGQSVGSVMRTVKERAAAKFGETGD
jgi:hypothetical protein